MILPGRLDLDSLRQQGVDQDLLDRCERESKAILDQISPAGAFGLPKLLDERRVEHGIIDGAFEVEAVYNRVFIWQLPAKDFLLGTYGTNSAIIAPQRVQSKQNHEAPRGIIVSAGLNSLDALRSHGMDLGHIVTLLREVPFRLCVGYAASKEQQLLVVAAGDISGSEDLALSRREGTVCTVLNETGTHSLTDAQGKSWGLSVMTNPRGTNGY